MAFNQDVANRVADRLRAAGVTVRRVAADPTDGEIAGDWDLFLTIHYDADVYNESGGFVDYPEPSTDPATVKSQAIAKVLEQTYFPATGIKNMPGRSNANTRYYYMWKRISDATPCVIIECGVGNRKPDDFELLNNQREVVVQNIALGILKALGMGGSMPTIVVDIADWEKVRNNSETLDSVTDYFGLPRNSRFDAVKTKIEEAVASAREAGFNEGTAQGGGPSQTMTEILAGTKRNGVRTEKTVDGIKVIENYEVQE